MLLPILIVGSALGAYLLSKRQPNIPPSAPVIPGTAPRNPSVAPENTSMSLNLPAPTGNVQGTKPGTVTIGGQPAPSGWSPGAGDATQKSLALAGVGTGAVLGLGGALGATASGGVLASGTFLGTALPVAGVAFAIVGTVLGVIAAHHKAALAAEGKALNEATPRMLNAMIMVVQGVIIGEIKTKAQATALLAQIVSDWYGEVKPIQHGKWPYQGSDLTISYDNSYLHRTGPTGSASKNPDAHAPDPCNAACVVGHYFVERNALIAQKTIDFILAGKHGVMVFPVMPAHATQQGFPEIDLTY